MCDLPWVQAKYDDSNFLSSFGDDKFSREIEVLHVKDYNTTVLLFHGIGEVCGKSRIMFRQDRSGVAPPFCSTFLLHFFGFFWHVRQNDKRFCFFARFSY